MAKDILRCQVKTNAHGDKVWFSRAIEDGNVRRLVDKKAVFLDSVDPLVGKEDLREHPLFLQILPCPHCGVEEDRGHDPLKHVDKRFGRRFSTFDE